MAKETFDMRTRLEYLEDQHRSLAREVTYLERRAYLTPTEQREASELKKRKLATKDAISALKARMT